MPIKILKPERRMPLFFPEAVDLHNGGHPVDPVMRPERFAAILQSFLKSGVCAMTDGEVPPTVQAVREANRVSAIGNHLKQIIAAETGVTITCGECARAIEDLNKQAPSQVTEKLDEIAADILTRGKTQLGWMQPQKWGALLLPGLARRTIKSWIQRAIQKEQNEMEFPECPFRENQQCELGQQLVGLDVPVDETTCRACAKRNSPLGEPNDVIALAALNAVRNQDPTQYHAAAQKLQHLIAPPQPVVKSDPLEAVTACITEFRRPESLARLIASIRQFYPDLKIDVEPTGGNVSAARNRLYSRAATPYILMLEEDFVFTNRTDLHGLLAVLESDCEFGGAAGCTHEPAAPGTVGRGGSIYWDRDFKWINDLCFLANGRRHFRVHQGHRHRPCDIVINFGIFKREIFQAIPWDENLPVHEHTDWYWRVYLDARWHFAYCPNIVIDHFRDRPDQIYNEHRKRDFTNYLRDKHQFRFVRDNASPTLPVPNILMLTVGRSGSSVLTQQLATALRLHLGEIDPQFVEHKEVRRLNQQVWQGQPLDRVAARRALRSQPQPWIIKDPRFRRTLPSWMYLLFDEFRPLLLELQRRNREEVLNSYERQGWHYNYLDYETCDKAFADWPFAKLKVYQEDIAQAMQYFDLAKIQALNTQPSTLNPQP